MLSSCACNKHIDVHRGGAEDGAREYKPCHIRRIKGFAASGALSEDGAVLGSKERIVVPWPALAVEGNKALWHPQGAVVRQGHTNGADKFGHGCHDAFDVLWSSREKLCLCKVLSLPVCVV